MFRNHYEDIDEYYLSFFRTENQKYFSLEGKKSYYGRSIGAKEILQGSVFMKLEYSYDDHLGTVKPRDEKCTNLKCNN